jgi:3'-phosphoadenosine 5'-phosphosulfate sulfotransferase (PAPS reductase)/FAD synthetase
MKEIEGQKVMIGLSGGINSMAVLCWLKESGIKPSEIHLFYAHFKEHSPDTFQFVADGIRFARKHFQNVKVKITKNSIINYFEKQNLIPHPMNSPCSKWLKIIPMQEYLFQNGIKYDLVGYVKHELKRRGERQQNKMQKGFFDAEKIYPIGEFTDDWCFEIVKKYIGWYPEIYKLKDKNGKRVFKHNNCLPCKNMNLKDFEAVKEYYPAYHNEAIKLSAKLKKYWGRSEDDFYFTFGRELGQESTCGNCKW